MAAAELTAADSAIALIQQVGFPIVVAGWFMFRAEKKLDRIAEILGDRKK